MAYLGIYESNSGLSDLRLYTDPSSGTCGKVCSICYHRIQTFKACSVVVQDLSSLQVAQSSLSVHINVVFVAGLWVLRGLSSLRSLTLSAVPHKDV